MRHWRMMVVLLSALLVPTAALAAPAGKVVIAQGVDPTTLDMMNQQEQPASNVGRADVRVAARARPEPQAGARAGRRDAEAGGARPTWEFKLRQGRQVPQRRGLQRRVGEVQPRAPGQPGQQAARLVVLRADRPGGDRRSLHRAHPHQEAVAGRSSTTSPCARPRCTRPRSTRARTRPRSRRTRSAPGRTSSSAGRRTRRS